MWKEEEGGDRKAGGESMEKREKEALCCKYNNYKLPITNVFYWYTFCWSCVQSRWCCRSSSWFFSLSIVSSNSTSRQSSSICSLRCNAFWVLCFSRAAASYKIRWRRRQRTLLSVCVCSFSHAITAHAVWPFKTEALSSETHDHIKYTFHHQ